MVIPGIALAGWKADRTGTGASKAATMPAGNQPTTSASGRDITVTWTASQLNTSPATSVTGGYVVKRYSSPGGVVQTILAGCAGTISALTCTENGVPTGAWQYTVTPKQGGWTGAESAKSAAITLTSTLTFNPASTDNSGSGTSQATVTGFLDNESVTFRLDTAGGTAIGTLATVGASGGTGTATITIPAGTTPVSHTIFAVGSGSSQASASLNVTAATTDFSVTSSTATPTAGVAFTVNIQAKIGANNDNSYSGTKCLTFSGPAASPNNTAPAYPAQGSCTAGKSSVTFANGLASAVPITLYRATVAAVTLTITDGVRTGTANETVKANIALSFTACPATKKNKSNTLTVTRATTDTYGNADSNAGSAITVSLSSATTGSFTPTSVTIAANATVSGTTSYTTPNTDGVNETITAHTTTAGYADGACSFTTTNS
jgi:hypothetical protein